MVWAMGIRDTRARKVAGTKTPSVDWAGIKLLYRMKHFLAKENENFEQQFVRFCQMLVAPVRVRIFA